MTDAEFAASIKTGGYAFATNQSTAPGTHRTRLNAYRHGLTGQIHLLTADEQKVFEAHCKGIVEALAPVGELELALARSVAENHWRLKRVRAIETGIFAAGQQGMLGFRAAGAAYEAEQLPIDESIAQALTWLAKSDNFQLLALYEQRINRTIERSMVELRTLRAERQAAFDKTLEEIQLLSQLAASKGEKYEVAADFPPELLGTNSVFSVAAITLLIARNQRLTEARDQAKTGVKPKPGVRMATAA
jgi:hypothetical protein